MAFTPTHDFLHKKIAYNFRMTNLQAAVALAQLERIEEILEKRRKIEKIYDEKLKNIKGITLLPKRNVLWMYDILAENTKELMKYLEENGIETRQFFKAMSQQPMYYNENWKNLKATKYGYSGLYLPTYTDLSEEEQGEIANKIKEFYERKVN
jgi:dTDP-4-amino-4,6-dideoxygalactose transaminase